MTWKEFKDFVESKGIKGEDIISYIDINSDGAVSVDASPSRGEHRIFCVN